MPISIEKARMYEKFRLPYASELVNDLLARTGNMQVVADIGAGTGQLSRMFVYKVARILAIEPDDSMRKVADEVLSDINNFQVINATGENTTLPDHYVDLILIGNAIHRMRPEAILEFQRILRPGGWIATIGYGFKDNDIFVQLSSRLTTLPAYTNRVQQSRQNQNSFDVFKPDTSLKLTYSNVIFEKWEHFFGAACAGMEAPEPDDPEFDEFKAIQQEVFHLFALNGQIKINYETIATLGKLKKIDSCW
jgi:ubiquinone/menaquinone biosynthesis C-methylase UbiE